MRAAVTTKRVHASRLSFLHLVKTKRGRAKAGERGRSDGSSSSSSLLSEWARVCGDAGTILPPPRAPMPTRLLRPRGISGGWADEPAGAFLSALRDRFMLQGAAPGPGTVSSGFCGRVETQLGDTLSHPSVRPSKAPLPLCASFSVSLHTTSGFVYTPAAQINGAAPRIRTTARAFLPAGPTWTVECLVCFYWQATQQEKWGDFKSTGQNRSNYEKWHLTGTDTQEEGWGHKSRNTQTILSWRFLVTNLWV